MKKIELTEKVERVKSETKEALQAMYDALNAGQQKQMIKNPTVKELFDRYGVNYK